MPTESFFKLVLTESLEREVSVVLFRIVSSLHCFNPDLLPQSDKGRFVKVILSQCEKYLKRVKEGTYDPFEANVTNPANIVINMGCLVDAIRENEPNEPHISAEDVVLFATFYSEFTRALLSTHEAELLVRKIIYYIILYYIILHCFCYC